MSDIKTAMIIIPSSKTGDTYNKAYENAKKILAEDGYCLAGYPSIIEEKCASQGVQNISLYWLGCMLRTISRCDLVYFDNGWEDDSTAHLIHKVSTNYGVQIRYAPEPGSVTFGIKAPDGIEGPFAYVDGSFNEETGTYGYGGFICGAGDTVFLHGHESDPELAGMRNVAGEILGAWAAASHAFLECFPALTILYDYQGVASWPMGEWKAKKEGTRKYAEDMQEFMKNVNIRFVKVKAHSGIPGNELADALAKYEVGVSMTSAQKKMVQEAGLYKGGTE